MGWEWLPETPEEIAEHRRMRKNLIECQQMYDSGDLGVKRKPRKKSVLVRLFLAFVVVCLVCGIGNELFAAVSIGGRAVPRNPALYIQKSKEVSMACNKLLPVLSEDFSDDGVVEYEEHSDEINILLSEIEDLQSRTIFPLSSLKEYERVCERFYGRAYTFFSRVKTNKEIVVADYNQFCYEINSFEKPLDCLVDLFEDNNFYYYRDADGWVYFNVENGYFLF